MRTGPGVLLVEDDRAGRRLYAEWLTQAGFRVDQAHNGLQALERALERVPDIVVTDLNIPGIDGFELTRRLKQDPRTRRVPVLAVTGYAAFAADPGRAQRAGCDVVLEKPCSPEDLEATMQKLDRRAPQVTRMTSDPPTRTRPCCSSRTTPIRGDVRGVPAARFHRRRSRGRRRRARVDGSRPAPDVVVTDLALPRMDGFELVASACAPTTGFA